MNGIFPRCFSTFTAWLYNEDNRSSNRSVGITCQSPPATDNTFTLNISLIYALNPPCRWPGWAFDLRVLLQLPLSAYYSYSMEHPRTLYCRLGIVCSLQLMDGIPHEDKMSLFNSSKPQLLYDLVCADGHLLSSRMPITHLDVRH